jgi:ketosteroid isomerase-like protein
VSVAENKTLVRRLLEEQAKGNLDVIDEYLSPDYTNEYTNPS